MKDIEGVENKTSNGLPVQIEPRDYLVPLCPRHIPSHIPLSARKKS